MAKAEVRKQCVRYFQIVLGCFIVCMGFNLFLIQAHLLTGGLSGVALIIYYLAGIPVGMQNIAYNLPKSLLRKQNVFQSIKVGFSCTNVLMLYSKMRGLDPESIYATSTNAIGFEYGAAPTSRAYVFNVSFGF